MSKRPNFLIFMPDQLRADCVGAFGNSVIQTPNLDALAARGTRFTNAFSQNSVCGPSRVSMFTGWYPHVNGHRTLTHLIKPWEPNLLKLLKDSGYKVAWAGMRGDTFAPGVMEESTDFHGFSVRPDMFFEFDNAPCDDALARAFYHGKRRGKDGSGDGPFLDLDEANLQTAIQWLEDAPEEPWVLFVAQIFPHLPFEVEEPWFSLHNRADMPRRAAADFSTKPRFMKVLHEAHGRERLSEPEWREIVATYYGMISRIDAQFGRLMDALRQTGQADETMTLFFTDHGEYAGDFDQVEKWTSGLDDCLLRNPLIIDGPGVTQGGVADTMVEMIDILPTLLDFACVDAQHTHFGKSLKQVLADPATAHHRDFAFSEGGYARGENALVERADFPYDLKAGLQQQDPTLAGKAISVRSHDWTYIYRLYESDEFYDRRNDPLEERNLIKDPAHQTTMSEMKDSILAWLVETADVIPWETDPRN
jgi:arylsulfatase A-like enzyme